MTKVLMIGQLPKEAGGNYTTGAAKVVYELSKVVLDDIKTYTYATNLKDGRAGLLCNYENEYIGYTPCIFQIVKSILLHPVRIIKELRHYKIVDHENPIRFMFYRENIKKAINRVKPDIIHVHSISNVSTTKFALEGKSIPILLTCHGIFYRGNNKFMADTYYGNIPFCDYFTGLTGEATKELEDILKIPREKYTIIPNGIDSSKFYFSFEERESLRKAMDIKDDTIVFLTVASLQERKGQFAFVKLLLKLNVKFEYWLIGTGNDEFSIKQYLVDKHALDKVRFIGYKNSDDLYKYYSAADVYAHTSWMEGQALSEIEAYATGLPTMVNQAIVGTVVGNVKEERDHYCVMNFDAFDSQLLLTWVMQKKSERCSSHKYDWHNIAQQYADVYKKILE